ncbi:hypothetical protein DYY67_0534 [Candidatus Nitrosotalea sp. TS]|nr:hypothetical protein [Candidatus Nitrosotalea sp. TS]
MKAETVIVLAELENWFAGKMNGVDQSVIDRVLNIAHYQKSKFEANNKFRIVSDGNDCSCGGTDYFFMPSVLFFNLR